MEFRAQDIAQLVLGYLRDTECEKAFREFLRTSAHLKDHASRYQKGRHFITRVSCLSLIDYLKEYALIYTIVQERLETSEYFKENRSRSLVKQLLYLLDKFEISTPMVLDADMETVEETDDQSKENRKQKTFNESLSEKKKMHSEPDDDSTTDEGSSNSDCRCEMISTRDNKHNPYSLRKPPSHNDAIIESNNKISSEPNYEASASHSADLLAKMEVIRKRTIAKFKNNTPIIKPKYRIPARLRKLRRSNEKYKTRKPKLNTVTPVAPAKMGKSMKRIVLNKTLLQDQASLTNTNIDISVTTTIDEDEENINLQLNTGSNLTEPKEIKTESKTPNNKQVINDKRNNFNEGVIKAAESISDYLREKNIPVKGKKEGLQNITINSKVTKNHAKVENISKKLQNESHSEPLNLIICNSSVKNKEEEKITQPAPEQTNFQVQFDVKTYEQETVTIKHDENAPSARKISDYDLSILRNNLLANVFIEEMNTEVEKLLSFSGFKFILDIPPKSSYEKVEKQKINNENSSVETNKRCTLLHNQLIKSPTLEFENLDMPDKPSRRHRNKVDVLERNITTRRCLSSEQNSVAVGEQCNGKLESSSQSKVGEEIERVDQYSENDLMDYALIGSERIENKDEIATPSPCNRKRKPDHNISVINEEDNKKKTKEIRQLLSNVDVSSFLRHLHGDM